MFSRLWAATTEAERLAARNAIVERFAASVRYILTGAGDGLTRRLAGFDFDDLVSEASLCLIACVERFEDRGVRFFAYLNKTIHGRLKRLHETQAARYRKTYSHPFEAWNADAPSRAAFDEQRRAADDAYLVDRLRLILRGNKAHLTRHEQRIIAERFGRGRPVTKIAAAFGVRTGTVNKWFREVFVKLRSALNWFAFRCRAGYTAVRAAMAESRRRRPPGSRHKRSVFGDWIMDKARRVGINTTYALAEATGINRRIVSQALQRPAPSIAPRTRQALCRALGIDEAQLTNWSAA